MPKPLLNLVVSDLHCGSDVGLMPPKMNFEEGQAAGYGTNKFQKWMWERWTEYWVRMQKIIGKDPFILTLTGDLIEGIHHRTTELMTNKLMDHLKIARVALEKIVAAAEVVHVIRGTECHVQDFESVFAKDIGAGKAHDFMQYTINGTTIDARHHMPVTSRLHLEASALGIIAANNRSNAVRAGHRPAQVFLRGHRHIAGLYSDGTSLVICTGAWQGLTRHGKKVVTDSIPRPSMALLDFRHTAAGDLPAVHHFVANPPQDLVAHVVA